VRDALVAASKTSGRSLAEEIEIRLQRSIADEHDQVLTEPLRIRFDALDHAFKVLLLEVATLVRDCWRGDDQSFEEFLAQRLGPQNTPPKSE
jgi:hypothetical protein